MTDFIYIFFLSIIVMYADLRLTHENFMKYTANGLGSIPNIIAGKSQQPMQYRVLVPWLCNFYRNITGKDYVIFYILLKYVSIFFALWCSYIWFDSQLYVAILALFFIAASIYDYTDGYLEVGFYALSFYLLSAQPDYHYRYLVVIVFLATLNRETSVFIPVAAFLTLDFVLGVLLSFTFMVGYLIPRIYYGTKDRYCSFNMIPENIRRIKGREMIREYLLFLMLFLLVCFSYLHRYSYSPYETVMLLLFFSLLVPAVWAEIRVFKPVMLVVIPMMFK